MLTTVQYKALKAWPDSQLSVEVPRLREQAKVLTKYLSEDGYDMLRIIGTVKYLRGIAERGTCRLCDDNETTEQFVLGYVKELEGQIKVLREALKEAVEHLNWIGYGDSYER